MEKLRQKLAVHRCALPLKDTQPEEPCLISALTSGSLGRRRYSQSHLVLARAVEHVGLWPPARTPASEQRTDKQKTWLAGTKPLLDFICDKVPFINPRTAHRRRGEQSNAAERGKTIKTTITVVKAGHKYLSSLSREEGQDDSSQFLVLTKEETVHETGHLPGCFYLSDPRVGTREA